MKKYLAWLKKFYEDVGKLAKKQGVAVNVITIKGNDCRLEFIGRVADVTGGNVSICDPLALGSDFSEKLNNKVIAYNTTVTVLLPDYLYFKHFNSNTVLEHGENKQLHVKTRKIEKDVGNATADGSLSFRFGVAEDKHLANGTNVPFQIQLRYTKKNGMQCMRTLINTIPLTDDVAKAEAEVNVAVVSAMVAHSGAELAKDGLYQEVLDNARRYQEMLQRAATGSQRDLLHIYDNVMNEAVASISSQIAADSKNGIQDGVCSQPNIHRKKYNREDQLAGQMYQMAHTKKAGCLIS